MPIEFQCLSCNKKLRVPETAVGKRAKCPGCQQVVTVPAASTTGAPSAPVGPPPVGPPASPVGPPPGPPVGAPAAGLAGNPYAGSPQPLANPYSTPVAAAPRQGAPARPLTVKEILLSYEGRIPRSIYWMWTLIVSFAFMAVAVLLAVLMGMIFGESPIVLIPLLLLYIPTIYVMLAIQVKRWHDRDKSGWWCLINLIPYIGGIWAFVEVGCLRGTMGPNQFGPDPLHGK